MPNDLRWAARYQFLEELWRGQPRVVVDPDLEHVLATAGPGFAHGTHPPLAELADELLPRRAGATATWFGVAEIQTEPLQRARPGTRFVSVDAVPELLIRQRWEVALVDLRPFLAADEDAGGPLGPDGEELLAALSNGAELLRTVVLTVPVRDYPRSSVGLSYDELAGLVRRLGGGRIYASFDSPMVGLVEFGSAVEPGEEEEEEDEEDDEDELIDEEGAYDEDDEGEDEDEDEDEDGDEPSDGSEDAPLTFDNTLAPEEPVLSGFVAVVGAPDFLAEGLTLVEVPPREDDGEPSSGASRAELQEVRRQADLVAIQRQQLMETVNALRHENAVLLDELDALRGAEPDEGEDEDDEREAPGASSGEGAPAERPDEDMAREQELRWRLAALEDEVKRLRARPVSEMEAEVATLRAQLARAAATAGDILSQPGEGSASDSTGAAERALGSAIGELDRLIERLERDEGLRAGEVRTALVRLRDRLRGA